MRKCQKSIFAVTILVFFSSFFGVALLQNGLGSEDKQQGANFWGASSLSCDEMRVLQHLLLLQGEKPSVESPGEGKRCCEHLFSGYFLKTGLGLAIAQHYFPLLRADFKKRYDLIQAHKFYRAEGGGGIGIESLAQKLAPSFAQALARIKSHEGEFSKELLAPIFALYRAQEELPVALVMQTLMQQARQQGESALDYRQIKQDLLVLGSGSSCEDWFGERFFEIVAQVIFHGAAVAQSHGMALTSHEVRQDLSSYLFGRCGFQRSSHEDLATQYPILLRVLGFTEPIALHCWSKVMLFREFLKTIHNAVVVDPLPFDHFQKFAHEQAWIELYQMPEAFALEGIEDVCKLELYLDLLNDSDVDERSPLMFPEHIASCKSLLEKAPELVESTFEVAYKHVDREECAKRLSVKSVMAWATSDEGWAFLADRLPALSLIEPNMIARKHFLQNLPELERRNLDSLARHEMLISQSSWVQNALEEAPLLHASIALPGRGPAALAGIECSERLIPLLERALDDKEFLLPIYSDNGLNFFLFFPLAKEPAMTIATFASCHERGCLEKWLDDACMSTYLEMRRESPLLFCKKEGTWRSLRDVRERVCRIRFKELLLQIESRALLLAGRSTDLPELPSSFYAQQRLALHLLQARQALTAAGDAEAALLDKDEKNGPNCQWRLQKTKMAILRSEQDADFAAKVFSLEPKIFSPIWKKGARGCFCRLLEKNEGILSAQSKLMVDGQNVIAQEAVCVFLENLLKSFDETGLMVLEPPLRAVE